MPVHPTPACFPWRYDSHTPWRCDVLAGCHAPSARETGAAQPRSAKGGADVATAHHEGSVGCMGAATGSAAACRLTWLFWLHRSWTTALNCAVRLIAWRHNTVLVTRTPATTSDVTPEWRVHQLRSKSTCLQTRRHLRTGLCVCAGRLLIPAVPASWLQPF